ncbi:uncharacterized protein [Cardiocondyla obscurior]
MATFLLFALGRGGSLKYEQRYNLAVPSLSRHLVPFWEYTLGQIILKSVIPLPIDINIPHKHLLESAFYGEPITADSDDDENIVLSRGNIYRLLNGDWMLCQNGCVNCEPCAVQKNPLFTWILRRTKPPLNFKATRHYFQLTLMPQANGHFYASSLWPNYYSYVTLWPEQEPGRTVKTESNIEPKNLLPENGSSELSQPRLLDQWQSKERDSNIDRREILPDNDRVAVQENASAVRTEKEESTERNHEPGNMSPRQQSTEKGVEKANQLEPRLILGTDQEGQKHLIHVVPADYPAAATFRGISLSPDRPTSPRLVAGQTTHSNNTNSDRQTYQRIFRRVFDSLNTHRRLIENFLELSAANASDRALSTSVDDMEVAESFWNNRDANRRNSFDSFDLNDALLSSLYPEDVSKARKYREYGNKYDRTELNNSRIGNETETSRGQLQTGSNFNPEEQLRGIRIKPYFMNNKYNPAVNSSVFLEKLNNYSVDTIQKSGINNGLVTHSVRQIDLNDEFIGHANNDTVESRSTAAKRENGQLFGLANQRSGDANRKFKAPFHAFRAIVTTKSPVIRSEHETLNRTAVLQITTRKTFPLIVRNQ